MSGAEARASRALFSTDAVPAERRVSGWEAYHASTLVGLRTFGSAEAAFRAATATLTLPHLRIATVTGTAHSVRRGAADIAAHPVAGAIVYIPRTGASTFTHHSGTITLGPGRSLVSDGDTAFTRDLIAGVDEIVVRLPRETVRTLTGSPTWRRPMPIDVAGSSAVREFARIADGLTSAGLPGTQRLEDRLLELLSTLIGDRPKTDALDDALAVIAEHHRGELSAARIAALTGISERQLSRLFAEAGQSVPRAVLTARLDTAQGILGDPSQADLSMAEVAAASGFRSQAQFSRSYRQRFGTTPLRARATLLGRRG